MKGEYLREGARSFLRLPGIRAEAGTEEDNELQMLCRGRLPGLLQASLKRLNGEEYLYYEVGSLIRLEDLYLKKRMSRGKVMELMERLVQQERVLGDYLLEAAHLLYDPAMIYSDLTSGELFFVLYPGLEEEREEQYGRLVEFLIKAADYEDSELLEAVYSLYDLVMNRAFSPAAAEEALKALLEREKSEEDAPSGLFREEYSEEASPMRISQELSEEHSRIRIPEEELIEEAPRVSRRGREPSEESSCESRWEKEPSEEVSRGSHRERELTEETGEESGRSSLAQRLLKLAIIPVILLELFFGWVWMNMALSEKELLLLGAGAASAACVGVICFLLQKKLEGEEEGQEESEDFTEPARHSEKRRESPYEAGIHEEGGKLIPGGISSGYSERSSSPGEEGRTEYFQPEEHLENRLYGLGKNRREIHLENLPFVVGKSKEHVDYQLQDNSVSRMHAKFTGRDGKVYLTDLNSTNGTFKNGLRLTPGEATPLEREDEIRLGRLEFAFR